MASRMAQMNRSTKSESAPTHLELLRELLFLFMLISITALGLAALIPAVLAVPDWGQVPLTAAALGLIAGFGTRWILRMLPLYLKVISGLTALGVGLLLLGWFSDGELGVAPAGLMQGSFTVLDVLYLAGGVITTLVSLLAWTQVGTIRTAKNAKPKVRSKPQKRAADGRVPGKMASSKITARSNIKTSSARVRKSAKTSKAAAKIKAVQEPKRRKTRQQVRMAGQVEQRCPFCLEPVVDGDMRGAVACEVCHTLHHADCWEITGTCQVPHQNP